MPDRIYLSPPHMSGGELDMVKEAFATNWIAPVGPHIDAFEREFEAATECGHAVALSSGTAALHLALRLHGIGPWDRVFVSTFTFVASVNPILYEGAAPVFIDSEAESWSMNPALLEEALADASRDGRWFPKAVVAVHPYGQPADLDAILAACAKYEVPLIEDAAESLGAEYFGRDGRWRGHTGRGRSVGTFGVAGFFSFNGNKIITTAGGGMLATRDASVAERARFLAMQARDPGSSFQHSHVGFNYRLSNVLAGIGRGQLRVLANRIAARRANFEAYVHGLGDLPGIAFMPEPEWARSTRWLTCLTIDPDVSGTSCNAVRAALGAANIECRPLWKPMHLQPLFRGATVYGGEVASRFFERGLCLPSGSNLTEHEHARICSIVRSLWRR